MNLKNHWEKHYSTRSPDSVSWFQRHAVKSLDIIKRLGVKKSARLVDIGGGASTLVDDLMELGYSNLSVIDISSTALDVAKKRLGALSGPVTWIEADVTKLLLPEHSIDVWHDRAVFHFLISESDRHSYVNAVIKALKPGGYLIVATFAVDGPEKCSGLPVQRYSASQLHSEFGDSFELLGHESERHKTPSGVSQSFVYCYWRRISG
jgi:ubiquinone/menaquinone biosynthesis C-methylase UbiE